MMSGGGYTSIHNQQISGSVPAVTSGPDHVAVKFADSNLQTFPPSQAQGKISGAFRPPPDADDTFSKPAPGRSSDEPQAGGWMRSFTVGAYKPYFDVDTSDVLERIRDSLFPFKGNFTEKMADNPDLYGPFWICTTLIFVAAAIGTFVTYLAHKWQKKEWDYDINLVTWSAGLFYGYVTIVPLALYLILKYFSAPSGLVQLWCLYGYSLFIFIPASVSSILQTFPVRLIMASPDVVFLFHNQPKCFLCYSFHDADISKKLLCLSDSVYNDHDVNLVFILELGCMILNPPSKTRQLWLAVTLTRTYYKAESADRLSSIHLITTSHCLSVVPVEIFRWAVAGVAGFTSATFVALNLRTHIKSAGERWFLIVVAIFLLQVALAIVLKLYFFTITVGK